MFDTNLVSQFHLLADDALATPPVFIAFDCLYARGRDLRARPLRDRRAVLEDEIADAALVFPSLRLEDDGFEAWAEVKRRGWEGLVAKDAPATSAAGRARGPR